jgi:hypothetical protein
MVSFGSRCCRINRIVLGCVEGFFRGSPAGQLKRNTPGCVRGDSTGHYVAISGCGFGGYGFAANPRPLLATRGEI